MFKHKQHFSDIKSDIIEIIEITFKNMKINIKAH